MWGGMQMVAKPCGSCQGSGRHFMDDCKACGGQGSVMVHVNSGQCPRCQGSGKHFMDFCSVCGGNGWSSMPTSGTFVTGVGGGGGGFQGGFTASGPSQCKLCNGNGMHFMNNCPGCNGQGVVMVAQPAQGCAKCHGSGKHFTDICSTCGGCGYAHRVG